MSFREKSAWAMAFVVGATGLYYLNLVIGTGREIGMVPPAATSLAYVIAVVILSIVAQTALALGSRAGEVETPADEREAPLLDKAGHWSGIVFALGVIGGLGAYLWYENGDLLFHLVLGSLILAQFVEFLLQAIWLHTPRARADA